MELRWRCLRGGVVFPIKTMMMTIIQKFERKKTFTGQFGGNSYYFTNKESCGRGNVKDDRSFEFKSSRTIRFWEPKGCDIRKIAVIEKSPIPEKIEKSRTWKIFGVEWV